MKKDISGKKRVTVAFLINQIDTKYPSALWRGISDSAEENDVNLMVFPGKSLNSSIKNEAEHNIIYELVNNNNTDGLILASGSLGNYISADELRKYYSHFQPIPMVSISVPYNDIPSILVDNEKGIHRVINHLVKTHKCRNIAFIRGPESNPEAQVRFKAYQDALKEKEIPLNPDLVVTGDFRMSSGREAVNILLDRRKVKLDAIAASNDEMALGAFLELRKRNIRIPEEIAITGYDDTEEMRYLSVPFTTVHQPLYFQGKKSLETLLSLIDGIKIHKEEFLHTELVVRQSCGCPSLIEMNSEINLNNIKQNKLKNYEKEDEKNLDEKKDIIIGEIMNHLHLQDDIKDNIQIQLGKVFSSFTHDLKEPKDPLKIVTLMNMYILKDNLFMQNINLWERILSLMHQTILSYLKDSYEILLSQNIFKRLQILINEVILQIEVQKRLELQRLFFQMRTLLDDIAGADTTGDFIRLFAADLFNIGINRSYIVLYQDAPERLAGYRWKLPENSRLIMAQDEKDNLLNEKNSNSFSTGQLLPESYIHRDKRFTFIIQPIINSAEQLGYMILEYGPKEEIVYCMLQEQVSRLLKKLLIPENKDRKPSA